MIVHTTLALVHVTLVATLKLLRVTATIVRTYGLPRCAHAGIDPGHELGDWLNHSIR